MKILYAGTPAFAVPALAALIASPHEVIGVYTQPDRPAGRGRQLRASPVKQFAEQHHLTIFQPEKLREPLAQQTLINLHADVMVVAAYGLLLPETILAAPRYGCINIHPSLLPRWRGAAPIQRSLLAGENETGITIMQMEAGLDTGPILYQIPCKIHAEDTAHTLHDRLAQAGANALLHALTLIEQKAIHAVSQNESLTCYAAKITKEEAQIDWQQSAAQITRAIRGYNPVPVAYTYLQRQCIRLWYAEPLATTTSLPPGTIIQANTQGIDVATGDGIARLHILQLPGGKPLPAKALLNARAALFQTGNQFYRAS